MAARATTREPYDGNDALFGGVGADAMTGGLGNDNFYVDNAGDTVIEVAGQGTDRVYSEVSYALVPGASIEVLSTTNPFGTAAIALAGNELANTVYGNYGNNVLNGSGGNDTVYGYNGADSFRFDTALGAGNVDTIGDYVVADDTIQLDDAVFAGLAPGALAAGAFNIGAAETEGRRPIITTGTAAAVRPRRRRRGGGRRPYAPQHRVAKTASEFPSYEAGRVIVNRG